MFIGYGRLPIIIRCVDIRWSPRKQLKPVLHRASSLSEILLYSAKRAKFLFQCFENGMNIILKNITTMKKKELLK